MSDLFEGLGSNWGPQPVNTGALGYFGSTPYGGAPSASPMGGGGGFMQGLLGGTDANGIQSQGWGMPALSLVQGIGNAFMGMKQYGLAKDQLAFTKEQFNKNYGAQTKLTNSRLADRQAARVAANPNAYQSVGTYMKENGI